MAAATIPAQEGIMDFSTVPHGTLPVGTETPFGVIADTTLTAYEMETGAYVPFHKVHGPYKAASPLVVLGWVQPG